ncbi:uncharacterized protein LOC126696682 [Quercus robur]|uniref:uncharacterized protein LOC126696682 n=1 Tax=Quercus robur TaxID=38942 RepID=UPI0021620E0D|nr:uncharacterized protein LOC126696682 [Quercus robur]
MEAFRNALLHCGLIDLGYRGNIFTWQNGRPGDAFVQERLDRACATLDWRERFPHVVVNHLQVSYSDHDPIFIIINGSAGNTRRKKIPKRFEEKWAIHPECEAIIQEVWSREPPRGSPMFRLFSKIRDCRMALVAWSQNMGSTGTRIEEKKQQLQTLTAQNDPANLELIQKVRDDINTLLYQEELAWRQCSRSIWLPASNKNTKFFHQRASQCCRKNNIDGLLDEGGRWCTSDAEI